MSAHLRAQLEVGLVRGYLELDIKELDDKDIDVSFHDARRLVREEALTMFTKQLQIIRESTSIVTRIYTLATLTSRNSWPILSVTAMIPVIDQLLAMIPWTRRHPENCSSIYPKLLTLAYISEASYTEWKLQDKMVRLESMARSKGTRPEVMIFGTKDWIAKTYSELSVLVMSLRERGIFSHRKEQAPFIHRHLFPLLHSGARALMYLVVAYQPEYFGMSISQLTFLESSVAEVFSTLTYLRDSLSTRMIKDMFRIRNLFECMDIKSQVKGPENPAPYVSHPKGMKVELKNVSFRYQEESPYVIKDVSFRIEPGDIVSIVGYNGSGTTSPTLANIGKTTLIRLLTFLDKPTTGEIYINGRKAEEYNPKVLRANMSILFQDFRILPLFFILDRKIRLAIRTSKHWSWECWRH